LPADAALDIAFRCFRRGDGTLFLSGMTQCLSRKLGCGNYDCPKHFPPPGLQVLSPRASLEHFEVGVGCHLKRLQYCLGGDCCIVQYWLILAILLPDALTLRGEQNWAKMSVLMRASILVVLKRMTRQAKSTAFPGVSGRIIYEQWVNLDYIPV
jgi:hypothetical protein